MSLRGGGVLEVAGRMPLGHLPDRFQEPMRAYLERGELTDPELRLLLEDDVGAAGHCCQGCLPDLWLAFSWIRDELPAACWGNRDQVQLWMVYVRRARGRALLAAFDDGGNHGEDARAEAR